MAAQNLVGTSARYRLPVAFAFGLVHGMGFAGTLQLLGGADADTLVSLLSFNAGIELGQILVILVLFPLLVLARSFRWSGLVQGAATAAVCCFGIAWFVERTAL